MKWLDENMSYLNYALLFIGAGLLGAALVGLVRGCLGSDHFGYVCYQDQTFYFVSILLFYGVTGLVLMLSILFEKQYVNFISSLMGWNKKSEHINEQQQNILEKLKYLEQDPDIKKIQEQIKKDLEE